MYSYLIIGAPRQGKSRYTKAMITQPETINRPCLVFDTQNEYGDTYKTLINNRVQMVPGIGLPANRFTLPRSRYASAEMDMDHFLDIAALKRGCNIIFEEATIFFEGRTDQKLRSLIVGRFHTGNNYIFVFHTICTIPPKILRMTNFIILFKTLDEESEIWNRYKNKKLIEAFKKQAIKPDGSSPEIIRLI